MSFIEVKHLSKVYPGAGSVRANDDINFTVEAGEFVLIIGPSGAGKSTLLNILGGMESATKGEVLVDGKDITRLSERGLTQYRRFDMGFVFQFYNLIENLTARENVELAAQIVSDPLDPTTVLTELGLGERLHNFPSQLSGGEQQRVSIARALAKRPKLLLCDEPTGALDYKTGKQVLKLLKETSRTTGTTVLVITHNALVAPVADKVIEIMDAKVKAVTINPHPMDIDAIEW
ncbi:ABC transporter ATP-binding protein [Peptoniphilus equinus]|uniref:ABC transporter ATP-binding protein n=1 Tax=Peptoniphilus equinus TaxID=3016343 RepID=A0ABY7QUT2_9FIRM|nr:ABC transporter ATP-binding protein [Peptoniphilus equinus]WBW50116.1 ABC transporter ATP-binding protein [Peptoniphilus equinus]